MQFKVLEIETGKTVASGYAAELGDLWAVAAPIIAEWFEVPVEDVCCGESEEHGDVIEIGGKAVATIETFYRRAELRRPMLIAAE